MSGATDRGSGAGHDETSKSRTYSATLDGVPVTLAPRITNTGKYLDYWVDGVERTVYVHESPVAFKGDTGSRLKVRFLEFVFDDAESAGEIARVLSVFTTRSSAHQSHSVTGGRTPHQESLSLRDRKLKRAREAAAVIEVFGWASVILGPILGIVAYLVNLDPATNPDEIDPWRAAAFAGFLVFFVCLIYGTFAIMISTYIQGKSLEAMTENESGGR